MAEIIIKDIDFEEEVLNCDVPVLVDFFATWCGPCKLIAPILSEIAEEYDGKIKVCKIDVDSEPALAQAFDIASIPTVLGFKGGELTGAVVGLTTKEKLLAILQ